MPSKRVVAIAAAALAAAAAAAAEEQEGSQEEFTENLLISPELDPVRSPDRVESLPVEHVPQFPDVADGRHPGSRKDAVPMKTTLPGRFRILDEPVPVPPKIAAELSRVLLDPASYPTVYKPCEFTPSIVFRFWRGKSAVDVLVCFSCEDLAFQVMGAPRALAPKLAFDRKRTQLARLAWSARPGDRRYEALR